MQEATWASDESKLFLHPKQLLPQPRLYWPATTSGFTAKQFTGLQCLHMLWLYWGTLHCRWLWYWSSQSREYQWRRCLHTAFILLERQQNTGLVVAVKSISGFLAMPCSCPKDLGGIKSKFVPLEQVKNAE